MQPAIDISDVTAVSNTTFSDTPTYTFKNPTNQWVIIDEIALGADSNFITNGKIQMKINGNVITSKGSATQEIGLIANLSIDFGEKSFIFLEPYTALDINARVTTGTGNIQCAVFGTQVTEDEFYKLKRKYLGDE